MIPWLKEQYPGVEIITYTGDLGRRRFEAIKVESGEQAMLLLLMIFTDLS